MDLIEWQVRNSHRIDVKFQPDPDRFKRDQLTEVLAPDERPVAKWNSNPYRPDGGGSGAAEDDGAYFLQNNGLIGVASTHLTNRSRFVEGSSRGLEKSRLFE
jgi:hypothetical protein